MEKSCFGVEKLIGKTPLVRLFRLESYFGLKSRLFAKLESRNPSGSVKDRAALYIIRGGEISGLLKPGGVILEATSGNMGISLSMLAATRGYRAIITMPRSAPPGRIKTMQAYGAEVLTVNGGMADAVMLAKEISRDQDEVFYPDQFTNRDNVYAHFDTTGREIYSQTFGMVDAFVCGVGSSGSFSGVGKYLKSKNKDIRLIAVEPTESANLSCGASGEHRIFGIGAGFLPPLFERDLCDEISSVASDEAEEYMKILAGVEGIFGGVSSGAALCSAVREARRSEGKNIITLLPDGGERYL